MPAAAHEPLKLREPEARQVVLVQAIETADEPAGALLGEPEREAAERHVLDRHRVPAGERPDAGWYVPARAREILSHVERRNPAVARLDATGGGWERLRWIVPLLAFAAGFASDLIGDPHQLDLVALPVLGFVLWNIAIYALLAVSLFVRGRPGFMDGVLRWLSMLPADLTGRVAGRLRRSVRAQFQLAWWRVAGPLEGARVQRVLHLSAAAWALGLIVSIGAHSIDKLYRVGWESTSLGAAQVQWIANAVSAPARVVLGQSAFSRAEIEALQNARSSTPQEGRRWAWMYVTFLAAVVVLPRVLLALLAAWRARRLASAVGIDLDEPYFARVMARVSPARIRVALLAPDAALLEALRCVLRQAAAPAGAVLRTPQHDELLEAAAVVEADLVWLAAISAEEASRLLQPLAGTGKPVIALLDADVRLDTLDAPLRAVPGAVLPLADTVACWALESPLRDAMLRQAPAWQRPGATRLATQWARNQDRRWLDAMDGLAAALAQSARDGEPVDALFAIGKRREEAMARLVARLEERLAELHRALLRMHGVDGLIPRTALTAGDSGWTQVLKSEGGAGVAGAVAGMGAGALAGAKIDLLTGGLTMGAGAAVGALVGGAGAFGAARFWELGGTVRLGETQLQALAEALLLQYLAVIHAGRMVDAHGAEFPARWQSEVVAAAAAQSEPLRKAWKLARAVADEKQGATALAAPLREACTRVLHALYPGYSSSSPASAP